MCGKCDFRSVRGHLLCPQCKAILFYGNPVLIWVFVQIIMIIAALVSIEAFDRDERSKAAIAFGIVWIIWTIWFTRKGIAFQNKKKGN
jgi:hypothetical protein